MKTLYFVMLCMATTFLFMSCENDSSDLRSTNADATGFGNHSTYNPSSGFYQFNADRYNEIEENPFVQVTDEAISTFSVDADGASYSNVRRYIMGESILPPKDAIRTEELINYFNLDYRHNASQHPVSINGEISECPWNTSNKLVRIGIKGEPLPSAVKPSSNFVFLIDVSGSMRSDDKLDLLKRGFVRLLDQLKLQDRVAIVTYAGNAGLALESTPISNKSKIVNAINALGAGGSTAGAAGIITAYEIAQANFIPKGNNRVILGTDGDFNVGVSDQDELVELIESKRDDGIFLTVLGVGRGNLNDAALEQIADNGNGTYEYIDKVEQMEKVFVHDFDKFFTVAKDVKVQVEFNHEHVAAYRLIGYENRVLENEEFEDDAKDAGEIGANQNITALYEIVPTESGVNSEASTVLVKFRYKRPAANTSIPFFYEIGDRKISFEESSDHMRFVASVASFSLLIRDSEYKGDTDFEQILSWLGSTSGLEDRHGYKREFQEVVVRASAL